MSNDRTKNINDDGSKPVIVENAKNNDQEKIVIELSDGLEISKENKVQNWKDGEKSLRERLFGKKKKFKKSRIEYETVFLIFLIYIFFSLLIPAGLAWFYYWEVLHPLFKEITSPIISFYDNYFSNIGFLWDNFFIVMQDPKNIIILLTAPLVFIGIYLLKLYFSALLGKILYGLLNWIRPRKELNRAKFIGPDADDVNVYHSRNFLLRILKWQFHKSPFPWLTPWMFNFVGASKIGKNVTIEEGLLTLEFIELGDNVYMGPMSATTSHAFEGTYGSLSIKTIKMGDNVVLGPRTCIAPGVEMDEDSQTLVYGGLTKMIKVPEGTDQYGVPSGRISHSKYVKVLNMPEDIQKVDRTLMKERKKKIREKRKKNQYTKNIEEISEKQ